MDTVSPNARASLERIFSAALARELRAGTQAEVRVTPLQQIAEDRRRARRSVVFTTAAIRFKLVMMFHVKEDAANRTDFLGDVSGEPFLAVLAERCNLVCGAVNRALQAHFPNLGLSTPTILSTPRLAVVNQLHLAHLAHFGVTVDEVDALEATLCVWCYAPIDFVAIEESTEEVSGELELL